MRKVGSALRPALLAVMLPTAGPAQGSISGGSREIWQLNFASLPVGDFPKRPDLSTQSSLEIVDKDGVHMLKAGMQSTFLIRLPEILPETFTLEFDLVPKEEGGSDDLSVGGTRTQSPVDIIWSPTMQRVGEFRATSNFASARGQLTKILASFDGGTLKLYTNGTRLYTLTDLRFVRGQDLRVVLNGENDAKGAVYLARVRVAEGIATPIVNAVVASNTGTGMLTAGDPSLRTNAAAAGGTGAGTSLGTGPSSSLSRPTQPAAGPAPTNLQITGGVATANLRWDAVTGATGYQVLRAAGGTTSWTLLTPNPISATDYSGDVLPDSRSSYTYQVIALQANGGSGSVTGTYTPPAPADPQDFRALVYGAGQVELSWAAVPSAREYLVSGPGIPPGTNAPWWDSRRNTYGRYLVTGVPAGLHEYQIATVYSPGGVLTPAGSWPKATVRLGPVSTVPFLSMPNGRGTPAEFNLHTCNAGRWLATQMVFLDNWCAIPAGSTYANAYALPLLSLFDINEAIDWRGFRIVPASQRTSFMWQWYRNGSAIPNAIFTDVADLGRSRKVGCVTRGSGPQSTVMCWGHSDQGIGARDVLNVIIQTWTETHFLSFDDIPVDPDEQLDKLCADCRSLPALGAVTLDSQGKKHLPHACMACHGGQFDSQTGKVTGASLLPLDPRGFTFPPVVSGNKLVPNYRSSQEEIIRQINATIFNTNSSVGVRKYITDMYGGRFAIVGATVDDNLVPLGWREQPALYKEVYRPYCALCHAAQSGSVAFTGWADLVREKVRVQHAICVGTMPHAELPLTRFWNDGVPATSRAAQLLSALGYSGC